MSAITAIFEDAGLVGGRQGKPRTGPTRTTSSRSSITAAFEEAGLVGKQPASGNGKTRKLLGYTTIGWGSTTPVHYGTHATGRAFDVTAEEAHKQGKQLRDVAQEFADAGYVVAVRRKGQPKIESDHLHIAENGSAEASRLKAQAKKRPGDFYLPGMTKTPAAKPAAKASGGFEWEELKPSTSKPGSQPPRPKFKDTEPDLKISAVEQEIAGMMYQHPERRVDIIFMNRLTPDQVRRMDEFNRRSLVEPSSREVLAMGLTGFASMGLGPIIKAGAGLLPKVFQPAAAAGAHGLAGHVGFNVLAGTPEGIVQPESLAMNVLPGIAAAGLGQLLRKSSLPVEPAAPRPTPEAPAKPVAPPVEPLPKQIPKQPRPAKGNVAPGPKRLVGKAKAAARESWATEKAEGIARGLNPGEEVYVVPQLDAGELGLVPTADYLRRAGLEPGSALNKWRKPTPAPAAAKEPWEKVPSVRPGGKPYFWYTPATQSRPRLAVVWDRIEKKWSAAVDDKHLGYYESAEAGKRALEERVHVPRAQGTTGPSLRTAPAKTTIIPYDASMKIVNTEQLARGTGARYLEIAPGQGEEFVAVQWRRKLPSSMRARHLLVDMERNPTPDLAAKAKPAEAPAVSPVEAARKKPVAERLIARTAATERFDIENGTVHQEYRLRPLAQGEYNTLRGRDLSRPFPTGKDMAVEVRRVDTIDGVEHPGEWRVFDFGADPTDAMTRARTPLLQAEALTPELQDLQMKWKQQDAGERAYADLQKQRADAIEAADTAAWQTRKRADAAYQTALRKRGIEADSEAGQKLAEEFRARWQPKIEEAGKVPEAGVPLEEVVGAAPRKLHGVELSAEDAVALDAAWETLRKPKAPGFHAGPPISPEQVNAAIRIATIHGRAIFRAGVQTFSEWSKAVVKELGEFGKYVRPHLRAVWSEINPKAQVKGAKEPAGIKNAITEVERGAVGLEPKVTRPVGPTTPARKRIADKLISSGKVDPDALVEQAFTRGLNPTENDVLEVHLANLKAEIAAGLQGGQDVAPIRNRFARATEAAQVTGYHQATALQSRATAPVDYDLEDWLAQGRINRPDWNPELETTATSLYDKLSQTKAREAAVEAQLVEAAKARTQARTRVVTNPDDFATPKWGADNKIITTEMREAARQRLVSKTTGRLSAGVDPSVVADLAIEIGYHVEAGVRFTYKSMRNYLRSKYNATDKEITQAYSQATNDKRLKASLARQAKIGGELKGAIERKEALAKTPAIQRTTEWVNVHRENMKLRAELETITTPKASLGKRIRQTVLSTAMRPLSWLVGFDDSHVLRQGALMPFESRQAFTKGAKESLRAMLRESTAYDIDAEITGHPLFARAQEYRLQHTSIEETAPLYTAEETSMYLRAGGRLGKLLRPFDRAFTTSGNMMRHEAFYRMYDLVGEKWSPEQWRSYAAWLNNMTARGELGRLSSFQPELSTVFVSIRKVIGDALTLAAPITSAPGVRGHTLKTLVKATATLNALAIVVNAAGERYAKDQPKAKKFSIGMDPNSPDFYRLRIGNTRFDLTGGRASILRGVWLSGKAVVQHSKWRKPKYGADQPHDPILRTLSYKQQPWIGAGKALWTGKDFVGQPITPKQVALQMVVPWNARDTIEAWNEDGAGLGILAAVGNFWGIGAQSYKDKKKSTSTALYPQW